MTITAGTKRATGLRAPAPRHRWRLFAMIAAVAAVTGGLGAALAVSLSGSSPAAGPSAYQYYRSVIDRYGPGSMMGGGYGWMTGPTRYAWMLGGSTAPGWMRGESLPSFMSGGARDPGTVMGRLFADAPGPRVSPSRASALGDEVPAGATLDHGSDRLTFTSTSVHLVVLASPSMPAESFRIAGMTNPTVVVPAGAHVSVELINADSDMAHGIVVAKAGAGSSWMPMATEKPAFRGAARWFLGESTPAGMHEGTLSFTAAAPGAYRYLCPVPGHAEEGMAGSFIVSAHPHHRSAADPGGGTPA